MPAAMPNSIKKIIGTRALILKPKASISWFGLRIFAGLGTCEKSLPVKQYGVIYLRTMCMRNTREMILRIKGVTLFFLRLARGFGSRINHQEVRWFRELPDQFAMLNFKTAFDTAYIARLGDSCEVKWNGFDQVVSDVHH